MDNDPVVPRNAEQAAQIEQNIEAIVALHVTEEQSVTKHQKAIERLVSTLGVPAFLIGLLGAIGLWIVWNTFVHLSGRPAWDAPPFFWLQSIVSLLSLVIMLVVVITQNRQGKKAEKNAHLDLQVNLLVDQKAAKIIQLLEEIRADSPLLRNRQDREAEELQTAVDPAGLATLIADKMAEPLIGAVDEMLEGRSPLDHSKDNDHQRENEQDVDKGADVDHEESKQP